MGSSVCAQNIKHTKVSVELEDLHIQEALVKISEASQVNIVFNPDILPEDKIVNRTFSDVGIRTALNELFFDTNLKYELLKDQIIVTAGVKPKQFHRVTGFIEDALTGERLISANIYNEQTKEGAITNQHGFYSLKLTEGGHKLSFSYLGYESKKFEIKIYGHSEMNVQLQPTLLLDEIIIHDSDTIDNGMIEQTMVKINTSDLSHQVGLGGENDIANLLRTQTGVQTSADGVGGLVIRGGSEDQNLLLLDGGAIYYPNHLFGVYSTVNSAAIRKTIFSKNNFLTSDGKRLSSVIDIRTRDGNLNKFQGRVGASLSAISGAIDGPIIKGKSSIVISGRKSLLTPINILPGQSKLRSGAQTVVNFYDYTLKWNTKIDPKNTLVAHVFRAEDTYRYNLDFGLDEAEGVRYRDRRLYEWDNTLIGLKWSSQLSDRVFFHSSTNYSSFHYDAETGLIKSDVGLTEVESSYLSLQSTINDFRFNADWDYYINSNHFIQFGVGFINHNVNPIITSIKDNTGEIITPSFSLVSLTRQRLPGIANDLPQIDFYLEDHIQYGKLKMNVGLFSTLIFGKFKSFQFILPKFALQYSLMKNMKWLITVQKTAQFYHKVDFDQSTFPNSVWIPIGGNVDPKTSWLISKGLEYRFSNRKIFHAELFYNLLNNFAYLNNTALITDNADFGHSVDLDKHIRLIDGYAYGMEASYTLYSKKINARINYTWSKTTRRDDQSNEVIRPTLDRRHTANLTITTKPTSYVDITLSSTYGSKTLAQYNYNNFDNLTDSFSDQIVTVFETQNDSYLSPNIRFDLSTNLSFNREFTKHIITFGVYNLTNRKNELYRYVDEDELLRNSKKITETTSLGIRPILSYKFSF